MRPKPDMARIWRLSAAAALAAVLSACATPPAQPPFAPPVGPITRPISPPGAATPIGAAPLSSLPGWSEENHAAALAAFREGCAAAGNSILAAPCNELRTTAVADPRGWLEARFVAVPVGGEGLLTGYYAPEHEARAQPDAEFSAPVRSRPADLVIGPGGAGPQTRQRVNPLTGLTGPYPDRAEIERQTPPASEILAWMRPEELFFMQIQGSGYLTFPDGSRRRAAYAADNGRPFVGLARTMRERGLLVDHQTSAANIKSWLATRRGGEADALMRENPRYIFFKMSPDDGAQPPGAANVALPAGRAIAVDPAYHSYGQTYWISADAGALAGAFPSYRRLVSALDTGSAIKGPVRADLYIGRGSQAGTEAGRIRHRLRMWRLVPR